MAKRQKEPKELAPITLFTISAELQNIIYGIEANGGEITEDVFQLLQSWQAELEQKGEGIAHVIARKEANSEYWKRVKASADAELKAEERSIASLKKYLRDAMLATNTKSIKRNDGMFSISLQAGRASVNIADENKLPYEFVTVIELVKPKTPAIKEALERGEDVPGASLEYGEPYITIRSKATKENNDE